MLTGRIALHPEQLRRPHTSVESMPTDNGTRRPHGSDERASEQTSPGLESEIANREVDHDTSKQTSI